MKCVILAGGLGSRLSEETVLRPKPMVEIGGKPMLWHIMKIYSTCGVSDFVICLGYRGYMVKEYFANYILHMSDVTFHMRENRVVFHHQQVDPWTVTLVDTGESTMTGGRLLAVRRYVGDETFCFTYGDGLADLDIAAEIAFHRGHGRLATLLAVQPPGRFGALQTQGDRVNAFIEKPAAEGGRINGGFFVLEPGVFDYIEGSRTVWEQEPLARLAAEDQLRACRHDGFWQPMDTLRERNDLERLWATGKAPWKTWD